MSSYTQEIEKQRKVAVKFIVHHKQCFMCRTNWSNSYSAGVMEFNSKKEALEAAKTRTNGGLLEVYEFNYIGERIK